MPKLKGRSSKSAQASIILPVSRIRKILRAGNFAPRIGDSAAIFLAAALEYLAAEILELALDAAEDNKKSRIVPRHLLLAIKNDDELSRLLHGGTISQGGVLPRINPRLLPKKTMKTNQESQELN